MKSKLNLIIIHLFLFVSCSQDEEASNTDNTSPILRGVEIVDNIEDSRFSMEFTYTDSVITSIIVVETNELFATYEYDLNKNLIRSNCLCNADFAYLYEGNKVSAVNDLPVMYSNDSILINGNFTAFVKEGNVVENEFSTRTHLDIEVPESFKHYYAIREDEHFPLHQDKNLIRESISSAVKTMWEYTFDGEGNVLSTRFKSYELGELLDDDTYNFIYE